MERSRAGYGKSESADSSLVAFVDMHDIDQAFPANAATFVSVLTRIELFLWLTLCDSWESKRRGNSWTSTSDDLGLSYTREPLLEYDTDQCYHYFASFAAIACPDVAVRFPVGCCHLPPTRPRMGPRWTRSRDM